MAAARPWTGVSAILLAILFNVPYAILTQTFRYPEILRMPAADALTAFAAGGPSLILTWYAFALCALAFVPVSLALALSPERIAWRPGLTIGAAIAGALAGLTQAIGLMRWVFVIPELARAHAVPGATADTRLAAERAFALLNDYGGVAIGEHMGQLLTALFVATLSLLQIHERRWAAATLGLMTATAMAIGTGEGLSLAMGLSGGPFKLFTIAGFLALTVWLIATGVGLLRAKTVPRPPQPMGMSMAR